MSRALPSRCRWCDCSFAGNRKYCSERCRQLDEKQQAADPTPEQIREMCQRIREAGGQAWERSHTCYPETPVEIRRVSTSNSVGAHS
ncbi:MAG: hypothetical protein JSS02_01325 [Planctomycetes bacterium]|nr:hypothetical protein [Planctomycetota bacterium]